MPQFDTRYFFSQIFWAVLCFGLVWSVVHFWVMPRLHDIYAKRSDLIKDLQVRAQDIEKQANDIVCTENGRLDAMHCELSQRLDQIKKQNQQKLDDTLEKMEQDYEMHTAKAQDHFDGQIQEMRSKILDDVPSLVQACLDRYHIENDDKKGGGKS